MKYKVYQVISNSNGEMFSICSSLFEDVAFISGKVYVLTQRSKGYLEKEIQSLYSANFFIEKVENYSQELKEVIEDKIKLSVMKKVEEYTSKVENHIMNRNNTILEIVRNLREQEEEIELKKRGDRWQPR